MQHCGGKGYQFEPHTPGWALLPELHQDPADVVVRKSLNEPFTGTDLQVQLEAKAPLADGQVFAADQSRRGRVAL